MKEKNISLRVEKLIGECNEGQILFVEGGKDVQPIMFNQRDVLRRINFYINSKFLKRATGIFWNISNSRITHFAKLISPDTKDFYPYGLGEHNFLQAWALRKKVKAWFDDNAFYKVLNDLSEGLATYGSIVWKRYTEEGKTRIKEVKLENLYFNQSVEWLKDADGIVELHHLNEKELRDKEEVWDNVDKLLDKDLTTYILWEYYGYDYSESKPKYVRVVGHGYGTEAIILSEEDADKDDCPYEDFHIGRYRGRWLRVGVPERLFSLQEKMNKLVNQNDQTNEISSLLLLLSDQSDSSGNVMEDSISGQILADPSLKQLVLQNPGLSQFIQEVRLIEQQADKICLTPEIIQGEASPSNTTFRGIAVVNAGAVTAFKNYRQDVFEKIANILITYIFPEEVKNWNREKLIEMAEDDADVETYDKAVVEYMKKEAMLSGTLITPEVEQEIITKSQEALGKIGRKITLADKFFNFKWGFKMMPTDESVDKSAKNDAYFNALQMIGANPTLSDIPLFKQYLEDNGISPQKITPAQKQELQQASQGMSAMPEPRQPDKLLTQASVMK